MTPVTRYPLFVSARTFEGFVDDAIRFVVPIRGIPA
jgi:hypothetical protein